MDEDYSRKVHSLIDLCRGKEAQDCHSEIMHWRAASRHPHRNCRFLRRVRARVRDLQQRGQANDAWGDSADIGNVWRGEPGDSGGDGRRRARADTVELSVSVTGIAGPQGAVAENQSVSFTSPQPHAAASFIHHERTYGDIVRSQVRRASVVHALAMLRQIAEKE